MQSAPSGSDLDKRGTASAAARLAAASIAAFAALVASGSASHATEKPRTNAPSWFSTPFGIVYKKHARETVPYPGKHATGTIIVSTKERYLYFVLGDGNALRYTVSVGKEGFAWAGTSTITAKREWPDWSPTPNIKKLKPDVPNHMKGGETNPLGARALYLGSSLYRIHGTNEPWTIGDAVSFGCVRLTNEDVIDLYDRAKIGATVIVQR